MTKTLAMTKKFTFRIGNLNDLNQIKDLTLNANMQYQNVLTKENVDTMDKNLSNVNTYKELFKTATCFVCENKSSIIGSAFLVPHGNPYKWFDAECSFIRLVAVHPKYEGNGIGKKLTQLCIDRAIETGENVITLHTSEFQNAARHIYESFGFIKIRDLDLVFGKKYYLYTLQLK